eukprot:4353548-Amphidinium_carterae.1
MAYVQPVASNAAEVDTLLNLLDANGDQVYSPISTPAQVVESDFSESETPEVLSGLDVKATFQKMITDWE